MIAAGILDARVVRLPTPQDLAIAYQALKDATEAVAGVGWLVREVAEAADQEERPDFGAPTFELIGRLAVYAEDAVSRLDEMREYVGHVQERLVTFAELQERPAESGTW
jgi:hypothetical protein